MKTKKQVIEDRPEYKVLINAVINRIGMDSIMDVNNHGIDGGFNGFIYNTETHKFAMRYRKYIISLLDETVDSIGEGNVLDLVSSFGVFRRDTMDRDDQKELFQYLGNGRPEQGTITNVLAWFAAEEVCRWFDE